MPDTTLNAMDLGCIPRSDPEDLNEISMADRLGRMEERLSALTEVVDRTVASNLTLKDQMNAIQQDSHASCQKPNSPNDNNRSYSGLVKSPPEINAHAQQTSQLGGNIMQPSTSASDLRSTEPRQSPFY